MTRVTQKSIKIFSYAVALLAAGVLAILGVQGANQEQVAQSDQDGPFGTTVYAGHDGGGAAGANTPWSPNWSGDSRGDDDDDDDAT